MGIDCRFSVFVVKNWKKLFLVNVGTWQHQIKFKKKMMPLYGTKM
jgi:DNA polymerase II small subunit/DNA polymerase delta subunit B